jgi:hypothetical protein
MEAAEGFGAWTTVYVAVVITAPLSEISLHLGWQFSVSGSRMIGQLPK